MRFSSGTAMELRTPLIPRRPLFGLAPSIILETSMKSNFYGAVRNWGRRVRRFVVFVLRRVNEMAGPQGVGPSEAQ